MLLFISVQFHEEKKKTGKRCDSISHLNSRYSIKQCIRHHSRLHDDAVCGPSSTFAQQEENIISAGQENGSRASFGHFLTWEWRY